MGNKIHWLEKEMLRLIPVVIYFAVAFNLLHYAQGLIHPFDIRYTSYLGATLGAIVAAKVIIIVDVLPSINLFPDKPIIYNIIWKFIIYSVFVLLVQLVDYAIQYYYATKSITLASAHIEADLTGSVFWGIQISVLTYFLMYIVFSEVTRVIGSARMKQIFFG